MAMKACPFRVLRPPPPSSTTITAFRCSLNSFRWHEKIGRRDPTHMLWHMDIRL